MKNFKDEVDRLVGEYIEELKEENRKLNEWKENLIRADKKKSDHIDELEEENRKLKAEIEESDKAKINTLNGMSDLSRFGLEQVKKLEEENKKLKDRIDILYEFIERNDRLVDEVIDEENLDKLNRYIYIDDDLVDRTLESED